MKKSFCLYNVTTAIKEGGIETFYWETGKKLIEKGYKVEMVTGEGEKIKYPHIPLVQFSFTSREKVIDLGNRFKKWWERVSFFKNSYSYLKAKAKDYDYFLIHKPMDFFTAFYLKGINPKLKTIFVSGGEDFYGFDIFFSKYIDYMFAVSNANKKLIERRYKKKVHLLPNGVDLQHFRKDLKSRILFRRKFNISDKEKLLISVGRIVKWKGYQLVVEILKNLSDVKYLLIGKGEYLEELKKLAEKNKVRDKIIFLGEIENKQLYKYLSAGDLFIQPSIGHEAFGITLLEAMACELPVIASWNGGMKEIIKEEENGFFFPINDKKALQQAIIKGLDFNFKNPRNFIEKHYSWEKSIEILLKVIK